MSYMPRRAIHTQMVTRKWKIQVRMSMRMSREERGKGNFEQRESAIVA